MNSVKACREKKLLKVKMQLKLNFPDTQGYMDNDMIGTDLNKKSDEFKTSSRQGIALH